MRIVDRASICLMGAILACNSNRFHATVRVVDEAGAPIEGATIRADGETWTTDRKGEAKLRRLEHPLLAVVAAEGRLSEPVPLGRGSEDEAVEVKLLDAAGRLVMHSTGDMMLGRRYLEPEEGDPLLVTGDGGTSAQAIVSDVATALALADFVTVNLETVVGDLPDADAYPGKRWLLQTPPDGLAVFDPLGVDVAGLANNHQRDWMEAGIESSLTALDSRGIAHVGGGIDAEEAATPYVADIGDQTVGVLAFTSVDGDYVNDQYPSDDDVEPDGVSDEDAFMWEALRWGEPDLGVAVEERRIGGAWQAIQAAEPTLSETDAATLWASAADVYPGLQDWVARRGHGGGRQWNDSSAAAIAALRPDVDLLVVQLHMGFQFASAPSDAALSAARAAVDAGADIVVCHHPHVLQGFEWYQGKLIAYSMGNFLFDQDFLSTFPSAFLRTVWEGGTLVQARVVPLMLDRYRPVPVTDGLWRQVGRKLWEAGLLPATAQRGADLGIRSVATDARDAPGFQAQHGTWLLTDSQPTATTLSVTVSAGGIAPIETDGLVRTRLTDDPAGDLWVGRALAGLGSFEDEDTDPDDTDAPGWTWTSDSVALDNDIALGGIQSLRLERARTSTERVSARMIARVIMPAHRLWADESTPLDGDATWSVRLLAMGDGEEVLAAVRVALYHFDDLDPTEDPESVLLREVELPFTPDPDGGEVQLDLPDSAFEPIDGLSPNAALIYISLSPSAYSDARLWVDDLELIDWRPANEEPDGWAAIDWVRSTGDRHKLNVEVLEP